MSDLKNRKYIIVRAGNLAPPPFPVGANNQGEPVDNVISGGKSHIVSPPLQFSTNYASSTHPIPWSSFLHGGLRCWVSLCSGPSRSLQMGATFYFWSKAGWSGWAMVTMVLYLWATCRGPCKDGWLGNSKTVYIHQCLSLIVCHGLHPYLNIKDRGTQWTLANHSLDFGQHPGWV